MMFALGDDRHCSFVIARVSIPQPDPVHRLERHPVSNLERKHLGERSHFIEGGARQFDD
jgi:hypothetical protein